MRVETGADKAAFGEPDKVEYVVALAHHGLLLTGSSTPNAAQFSQPSAMSSAFQSIPDGATASTRANRP